MIIRILIFIGIVIFICTAIALLPVAGARLFKGSRSTIGWSLFLIVMAALGSWVVRSVEAEIWKSDQHMHIRIDNAERAASMPKTNNQAQEKQESGDLEPQKWEIMKCNQT